MTVTEPNRVPIGVAGAGRFADGPQRTESPVKLFDRNDGSYFHPSPSSTAENCIYFWSNVAVPDEAISQVESAYYNDRVSEIDEDMKVSMEDWSGKWLDANPKPKREKDVEAYNATYWKKHEEYRLSILPEVKARRPLALMSYDSRQIIRAFQMAVNRPHSSRFPEESEKTLNHEIELYDETLTVREVEIKYRLTRIKGYVTRLRGDGSQAAMLEAAETANEILESIKENLVYQRLEARDRDDQ